MLRLLLSVLCLAWAAAAHAQAILHLAADTAAPAAGSVLHLSVTSPLGGGTVTFFDGTAPIASLPLSASGTASLGTAALAQGPHTLSATVSTGAGPVPSNNVQITVSGLPAPFNFTASPVQVLPGQPLLLTTAGLPADATGSVSFSDAGVALGTATFAPPVPTYIAYGDGVTLGSGLSSPTQTYPGQLAADLGLTVINRARPPFTTCDILPHQILDFGEFAAQSGPTQTTAPLTSLMPGENDTYDPSTLDTFQLCYQATLAWLAVPREYKVLAGDLAMQATAGAWLPPSFTAPTGNLADPAAHTLFNAGGSGSARITLTTDGGPIYLWYLLQNSNPGQFTLTLDGVALPGTYGLNPPQYMLSTFGASSSGFALARLTAPAGRHTVDVTLLSGALGLLGAGTPPGAGAASVHPTVLAADLPSENVTCARDSAGTLAAFSSAVQADATQLAADGLDVRFVPTHAFMTGSTAEMADCALPNALGARHLADALEAVLPASAVSPGAYLVSPGTALTLPTQLQTPGRRSLLASFPGDARYAPAQAGFAVTVQNPATTTSLTAASASLGFGAAVHLAATVSPAANGSVRFYEATGTDASLVDLDKGMAATFFNPPPGRHTYYAAYHSDDFHSDSLSPPVTVQVAGLDSVLTVAVSPLHIAYGQPIHLTANLSNAGCNGLLTFNDALLGPLGSLYVAQGTGAVDVPALPGGTRLLSVAYSGDPLCAPASSAPVQALVDPLVPSLAVTPLNQATFPEQQTLHVDLLGFNLPAQPMLPGTLDAGLNQTSVFMGDSITQYWPLPVHNAGIAGQTTTQMLARFPTDVLGHGYERVFILGGTNDFWHFDAPLDQVLGNLAAMAQMAAAAGIRPILCSVMPFSLNGVSQEYRVVPLNAAIAAYAAQNGFDYIDYHTSVLNFPQYFPDGIHPADPGHALMETTLARTLLLPTGTVSLPDGSSATLSPTGTATLITGSQAGSFAPTLTYSGDTSFLPVHQAAPFTIARATTTTLLRVQPQSPSSSQSQPGDLSTIVTLAATVSGAAGPPAEATLRFLDGAALLGTAPILADGSASLTTGKLSAGSHSFSAAYPGGTNLLPSNSPAIPLAVSFVSTTLGLSTPALNARTGAPVPLTASLTPASLSGVITFLDGTNPIGTAALANGVATLSISTLSTGTHTLTASFAGDASTSPAQSPALSLTIAPANATLSLASLPATAVYGTTFNLTANIAPADATGQVTFTDAGHLIGQANLLHGQASVPVIRPSVGSHTFAASYPGDSATQPAVSPVIPYTVTAIPTTLTLSAGATSLTFGSPSPTLTATVTPVGAGGTVTFTDASTGAASSAALSNGVAALALPALTCGTHTFTAGYAGDSNDAPATSAAVTITVTPAVSSVTLAPLPATIPVASPVTLSATLAPPSATGTVLFRDALAGILGQATVRQGTATLSLGSLPATSYSITAVYSGDLQDLPATSAPVATQVTLLPAALALTGPVSSPLGADVTLTAAVTPATLTGLVTFTDNGAPAGTVLLANGTATLHTGTLTLGAHTVRAGLAGDATHTSASAAPLLLNIVPDNTTTTLSLAQPSVPAGAPVTINLAVTSMLGGTTSSAPSGIVTVRSGSAIVGTAALTHATANAAYATLTLDSLSFGLGTFQLTAAYPGDPQNSLSGSSAVTLTIVPAPTTALLTLSTAVTALRTPLMLTVAVQASTNVTPTGSVAFLAGSQMVATVPLTAAGTASTSFTPTTLGEVPLSAIYHPDSLFAASTAPLQTLTVTPPVALALARPTLAAAPGTTLEDTLTLTPLSGFTGAVSVTCTSPIFYITCTASAPAGNVSTPTSGALHITISPTLSGYQAGLSHSPVSSGGRAITLVCTLLALLPFRRRDRHLRARLLLSLVAAAALLASTTGCATGPQTFDQIPAGAQVLTVTVTAAGLSQSLPLTVNIQ